MGEYQKPTEEQASFRAPQHEVSTEQDAIGAYSDEFAQLLEECGGDPRIAITFLEMRDNGFDTPTTG